MQSQYRSQIKKLEKQDGIDGFSIFTTHVFDTLNIDEFVDHTTGITIINEKDGKSSDIINEDILMPSFTIAEMVKDTLFLSVGGPFFPRITHQLHNGTISSFYEEYYKHDSILRLDLFTPKVSTLNIPITTTQFTVSTNAFKRGKVIYGSVKFETASYYSDAYDFKNGYVKKRLRGQYVFKVRVRKNSTLTFR